MFLQNLFKTISVHTVILYLIGAFISTEFDFTQWDILLRVVISFVWVLSALFSYLVLDDKL